MTLGQKSGVLYHAICKMMIQRKQNEKTKKMCSKEMVPCLETMSIMLIVIGEIPFSRPIPPTVPCMSKGLQFHLQVILRNRCFLQQEIRCVITIITIIP